MRIWLLGQFAVLSLHRSVQPLLQRTANIGLHSSKQTDCCRSMKVDVCIRKLNFWPKIRKFQGASLWNELPKSIITRSHGSVRVL